MDSAAPNTQRFRILCVDDEPAIRDVLRALFEREGHVVETASDGQVAWEMVSRDVNGFDLVITDNEMPNLTGLALVERLRDAGYARNVLMFSASIMSQAGDRLSHLNVAAVVEKGHGVRDLVGHVRRLATAA